MRQRVVRVCVCILCFSLVEAQKNKLIFTASNLYEVTSKLTGDSTLWPVVVKFAERDISKNSFALSSAAQRELREFAIIHKQVNQAKQKLPTVVKNGAKVFATVELDSTISYIRSYDAAINNGNIEGAQRESKLILGGIKTIEQSIDEQRNEPIDAKLAQKTGTVDKRRGYLGAWQAALLGDLFVAYDGVRTAEKSLAQLFFIDGVDVTVDANTTLIIRESHRDKLSQTLKKDIALLNGSLLAKLSAKAKETNDFSFQAGTAESSIKSGKFWASAVRDKNAKLSNYDGTIDLAASNVKVTLQSNQGTIIEKGKPPLPPINLLDPPQLNWIRTDTVIYSDKLQLMWQAILNAVTYQIEMSPSKNFDRENKRFSSKVKTYQLAGLPMASTYVRLQAIDKYGLRGIDSPVYTIVRTKDTQPPAIHIDGWETDRRYTVLDAIIIRGSTEAEAKLVIEGKQIKLDQNGLFVYRVLVHKPETQIHIAATDQSGNVANRLLSIVPMDTVQVFRIDWNCQISADTLHPLGETIEARGTAYPRIRVTAELGTQKNSVLTSSQGFWAVSLKAEKSKIFRLSFDSIDDEKPVGSRMWEVK